MYDGHKTCSMEVELGAVRLCAMTGLSHVGEDHVAVGGIATRCVGAYQAPRIIAVPTNQT